MDKWPAGNTHPNPFTNLVELTWILKKPESFYKPEWEKPIRFRYRL